MVRTKSIENTKTIIVPTAHYKFLTFSLTHTLSLSHHTTKTKEGNEMLREIIRDNVPRYISAKTKHDKGEIIVEILETIKANSPSGLGLIRQNPDTKRWYYIGTDKAKDKIGHALRKASRDVSNGGNESSIKPQKREGSSTNISAVRPQANGHCCSKSESSSSLPPRPKALASPRSAFSSSGSVAIQSFKMGPSAASCTNRRGSAVESSPMTSVNPPSSSESYQEDLLNHPVQVTVPSSPVTRPSSAASSHNSLPHQEHHHHDLPHHSYHQRQNGIALETHYDRRHSAGSGGYYGPSYHPYPYHPQQCGKEEHVEYYQQQQQQCSYYNHHTTPHDHSHYSTMTHQDNANMTVKLVMDPALGNRSDVSVTSMHHHLPHHHHRHTESGDYAILCHATSHYPEHCHQYDDFPLPLASDGAFHHVFDEVESRLQQEEEQQQRQHSDRQQNQQSYHQGLGHQHLHYTPTAAALDHSFYTHIVSTEGTLPLQNL
jgi:hypothetical protein